MVKVWEAEGVSRNSGDIGEKKKSWSEIASKITIKKLEKNSTQSIMKLNVCFSAVRRWDMYYGGKTYSFHIKTKFFGPKLILHPYQNNRLLAKNIYLKIFII